MAVALTQVYDIFQNLEASNEGAFFTMLPTTCDRQEWPQVRQPMVLGLPVQRRQDR